MQWTTDFTLYSAGTLSPSHPGHRRQSYILHRHPPPVILVTFFRQERSFSALLAGYCHVSLAWAYPDWHWRRAPLPSVRTTIKLPAMTPVRAFIAAAESFVAAIKLRRRFIAGSSGLARTVWKGAGVYPARPAGCGANGRGPANPTADRYMPSGEKERTTRPMASCDPKD